MYVRIHVYACALAAHRYPTFVTSHRIKAYIVSRFSDPVLLWTVIEGKEHGNLSWLF
jgi:hypothetical protein